MRVLILEPYLGGSHQAFLEGWRSRSRHEWTLQGLPANKWKWRMRHSAVTFARRVAEAAAAGGCWDVLLCSDMLGLAEFRGLAPRAAACLPCVVYFHENQLTYPVLHPREYDYHFAFSNLTSALAADEVWFNSAFHRDAFLDALDAFLKRMPDHRERGTIEVIRRKSQVHHPGIPEFVAREPGRSGPLHIMWAARWEHDKGPATFFEALDALARRRVDFRLSVIGGGDSRDLLPVFERARERFHARIAHWGYQESREAYESVLREADVVVSTAEHEFFGISVAEAIAAGAFPLVPHRLAYPEVLGEPAGEGGEFFYGGEAAELARRLETLAGQLAGGDLWAGDARRAQRLVERFAWPRRAAAMDDALSRVAAE